MNETSAESSDATRRAASYELPFDADGTSLSARENLVDLLQRELLGPIGGTEETIAVNPRKMYLVGHIAPVKIESDDVVEAALPDDDDSDSDLPDLFGIRTDASAPHEGRGVPVESTDESVAGDSKDGDEDRVPKQGLMIPASMGLRFQVPIELESFSVTASWGMYESEPTGETREDGSSIRHYRRTPVEVKKQIDVGSLLPGQTHEELLSDSIKIRIDCYTDELMNRRLVEIALCNDRETPQTIPVAEWMFQTKMQVDAGGADVFLPVNDPLDPAEAEHESELKRLQLQYRKRLEFAIGRTCSAGWNAEYGAERASAVWTTWLPVAETPQTKAANVEGMLLSMDRLSAVDVVELRAGLMPLVEEYGAWLSDREGEAEALPEHLRVVAKEAIAEAEVARGRLREGIEHVLTDDEALRCFRFMNRVMRDQRLRSQVAAIRGADSTMTIEDAEEKVSDRGEAAASWYPFQLAFILMQLPALTDPAERQRSSDFATVELLFFPTGGGKTEAYLGLAAYAFAIRRRQGIIETPDGKLNGLDGVSVLMRYTLRLLTSQQFQRATALVCAAELARREDEQSWGSEPFRIGLWVGSDVSPKRFEDAVQQLDKANTYGSHGLTVRQLQRCPWCGTEIEVSDVKAEKGRRRVTVHCGDDLGRCAFSKGGVVDDGLPILTTDEEIYRLVPAFVIATVDKFARLAREGEAASLFGYVSKQCGRHGYVHPDFKGCDVTEGHSARGGLPKATIRPVDRLRPPDLIIQDELHLITGALGTTVGLFEVAIETLCTWRDASGQRVQPMIVASTATVRNASNQVRGLYGRGVEIFPPQVLDVADTFFSEEVPITTETPGRKYIGVSAQGVRLSDAEIRIAETLMLGGQLMLDRHGEHADPYMTLVGYFNATRELAGMTRYMADDVQNRIGRPRKDSGLPRRRSSHGGGRLNIGELTSRISADDIGKTLDRLALGFRVDFDSTEERLRRSALLQAGKDAPRRGSIAPFDAVLATSMLQVGVDVQRLGLMLVVGQPKNTAEYIQATSRVGRDSTARPGLVVSLGNWARPRDLAHFEQFRHYHATFYAQVEALSVTPFSQTSIDRGVGGLLVGAIRVLQAPIEDGLSPKKAAGRFEENREAVKDLIDRMKERISRAAQDEVAEDRLISTLENRLDVWSKRNRSAHQWRKSLVYEVAVQGDETQLPLLISPEDVSVEAGDELAAPFVAPNSMREVQPEINILVSPIKEKLLVVTPDDAPTWDFPKGEDE